MCRNVMTPNAITRPAVWAMPAVVALSGSTLSSTGWSSEANAGSPIHPRPSDISVMPLWLAESQVSRPLRMASAARAPPLPRTTAAPSRVGRTLTIEYSKATKKPLAMTRRKAPPSASHSPMWLEQRLELGVALERVEHRVGGEPPGDLGAVDG